MRRTPCKKRSVNRLVKKTFFYYFSIKLVNINKIKDTLRVFKNHKTKDILELQNYTCEIFSLKFLNNNVLKGNLSN